MEKKLKKSGTNQRPAYCQKTLNMGEKLREKSDYSKSKPVKWMRYERVGTTRIN